MHDAIQGKVGNPHEDRMSPLQLLMACTACQVVPSGVAGAQMVLTIVVTIAM